jgi:coenzyme PQQ precursor peptide PqqA
MKAGQFVLSVYKCAMEEIMAWTTPTLVEVCVGMEVTSYESAEI